MKQSDQQLFNLLKGDDVKAFEAIFNKYYVALCGYANRLLEDMDRARDITQDVFVSIYENRSTIIIKSSVKAYLYRSVHNACLNELKKTKAYSEKYLLLASQVSHIDDQDTAIYSELESQVLAEIQKLPEQCRNIFEMNRFQGRKNRDIAVELGISVRTVETQISKALKILRKNLNHLMPAILLLSTAA